jgi:hypothetical protein
LNFEFSRIFAANRFMKKWSILFGAAAMVVLSGWGFLVHRTSTQLAVYELPKPMRAFFHENLPYIVKYSVRPDQRRNEDSTEAPKHYIDIENFGDSAAWKMPHDYNVAIAKYSSDSLNHNGYLPYWIMIMQKRLTDAFANRKRDSILFYATDLAHYLEDANVPLHTTANHDGQLTNQKGLHSLWESMIPEIDLSQFDLSSRHKAKYLSKPEEKIWAAIQTSHALLPQLFQEEKNASIGFTDSTKFRVQMRNGRESKSFTSAFAKAYNQRLGKTINQQLIASADMVADFWYTAWVDAGKPDLAGMLKTSRKFQKKQWKKEYRSFKKNHILRDSLLIARKNAD